MGQGLCVPAWGSRDHRVVSYQLVFCRVTRGPLEKLAFR